MAAASTDTVDAQVRGGDDSSLGPSFWSVAGGVNRLFHGYRNFALDGYLQPERSGCLSRQKAPNARWACLVSLLARYTVDIHEIVRMAVRVEQHPTDGL